MRWSLETMRGVALAVAMSSSVLAGTPLTTTRVASGLSSPVYATHAPGDTTRLFIVEQIGRIRILDLTQDPPALLAGNFLNIQSRVTSGGERGLLGLAFHPNYASNGYFYVNYTRSAATLGDTVIARYETPIGTPNDADESTEQIVMVVAQPDSNHNGGWIDFGPDGYLYVAMGDGGSGGDPWGPIGNGQNIDALLGKMLRIDVDGDDFPADPLKNYAIPGDNPFVGVAGADEIWHVGLRNPWRNAFDSLTGDLYIADVGQNAWEEINFQPASSAGGENWGWRCREGAHNFNFQAHCSSLTLLDPIHEYSHGGAPFRCSITGGEVYRGSAIPDLQGTYFFADFCSDQIWSFAYTGSPPTVTDRTAELDPPSFVIDSIASFGRDAMGEIYILGGGEAFKIVPETPAAPAAVTGGSRYVSVTPAAGATSVALRVTSLEEPCVDGYVDANGLLTGTPFFQSSGAWGTAHVRGPLIAPNKTYQVVADYGGGLLSPAVSASTAPWGDVASPFGTVNFADISGVVATFVGASGAPTLQRSDLVPLTPDRNANFQDISACVLAFQSAAYPYPDPCP